VDSKQGIVHSAEATAANIADSKMLPELLHGKERKVWGDAAYQGRGEKIRGKAPHAQIVDELQRKKNRTKALVRSKVEHVFRVMKRQFGFDRVRYRDLAKNANRIFACLALVNLYLTRKRLALECPAPLVPESMRQTGMRGALNGTRKEAYTGADCELAAAD
jgi:IS5 family transposase